MASLCGFILSLTKDMIPTKMSQRSKLYCSIEPVETLSFGDQNGSLPIDLPFYKLIELGTVYRFWGSLF